MQISTVNNSLNPPVNSRGFFRSVLILLACFLIVSGISAQAKMKVEEHRKSFGHVKKGETVELGYKITNAGDEPLLISEAEVACDCTSARYPGRPVLPGESVMVTVLFDTKSAYGRQDRIVKLHSNDPKSPAKIRFKGTVDTN